MSDTKDEILEKLNNIQDDIDKMKLFLPTFMFIYWIATIAILIILFFGMKWTIIVQ